MLGLPFTTCCLAYCRRLLVGVLINSGGLALVLLTSESLYLLLGLVHFGTLRSFASLVAEMLYRSSIPATARLQWVCFLWYSTSAKGHLLCSLCLLPAGPVVEVSLSTLFVFAFDILICLCYLLAFVQMERARLGLLAAPCSRAGSCLSCSWLFVFRTFCPALPLSRARLFLALLARQFV